MTAILAGIARIRKLEARKTCGRIRRKERIRMEQDTLDALKSGDEKAFRQIYEQYYDQLCRFAAHLLRDHSVAEEIVDNAIYYLWEHRDDISITHSVCAYLFRAVRNSCLNELKKSSRHSVFPLDSFITPEKNIGFLDYIFSDGKHPLGDLLENELESKLKEGISELPDKCREVFVKSRFEQRKYDEIAKDLGISVNTVKYHLKTALSFLRGYLADYLKALIIILMLFSR